MLKFVNISAYFGRSACLFLLLKALKLLLLSVQALGITFIHFANYFSAGAEV